MNMLPFRVECSANVPFQLYCSEIVEGTLCCIRCDTTQGIFVSEVVRFPETFRFSVRNGARVEVRVCANSKREWRVTTYDPCMIRSCRIVDESNGEVVFHAT